MKQEDVIFLQKLNKRKSDAYEALYQDYYRSLVLYALNFVRQKKIAEDIVQDLFISIWEREMTFISLLSLKTFLYNSIKNKSLNYIKHLEVEEKYIQFTLENVEEAIDMDREMDEEEIYRQLFLAIEKLPVRCREVFEMYMDGKRNDEIAEALNISIETVKTQKKRAVKHLKSRMSAYAFILVYFILSDTK
ncbi:DNA-directed RNA polymerase sigma-70 factor [Bacteroidia bacterium]|nr:DNA-directed RNA polymerase sigma-70 factor [Bacteroidia bacterium]